MSLIFTQNLTKISKAACCQVYDHDYGSDVDDNVDDCELQIQVSKYMYRLTTIPLLQYFKNLMTLINKFNYQPSSFFFFSCFFFYNTGERSIDENNFQAFKINK